MANHAQGALAPVSPVLADLTSEIIITINSVGHFTWAEFHGTRAQIEAEGIGLSGPAWPATGFSRVEWREGGVRYLLRRAKPNGAKGPRKAFADVDWWVVRSDLANFVAYDDRIRAIKVAEIKKLTYELSPEGLEARNRRSSALVNAMLDKQFQAFLACALGQLKQHRRRVCKDQGGRHAA